MATDPASSIFTFHEPLEEIPNTDPALSENTIPGHFELPVSLNVEQNPPGYPDHQSGLRLNDLFDPFCWGPCNGSLDDATIGFQSGYSGLPGEGCSYPGLLENNNGSQNPVLGDDPVSAFSFYASASCTDAGCEVLRDITHTKGMHVKRLQIHGRLDLREFAHAIIEECDSLSPIEHQRPLMFDFQNGGYEQVKNFLVEYLEICAQEGYDVQRDHPSNFYDTLSVGSNQGPGFIKKHSLKEQRQRTRKMKATDFKEFIELPMETAAREMNICITTMKKICWESGVKRWPYRKIKSLRSKIEKNSEILDEDGDDEQKTKASEDKQKCEQELDEIYKQFTQS